MIDFFEKLRNDRIASAQVLEKPSMQGIKMSVVEKYSERAHFIFELIQNADDVQATYIKFVLDSEGLFFIHDGKIKFNVTNPETELEDKKANQLGHINAITSIGQSAKTENEIGKFGVGFKAVFQYCETPQIFEDNYKFEIERFIIPTKLEKDIVKHDKDETVFYFPFNNVSTSKEIAFADISQKFKTLQNPLLFVNYLKQINWEIKNEKYTESGIYSKEIKEDEDFDDINLKKIIQRHKKDNELLPEVSNLLMFTRNIQIENKKFNYSIVFFLEQENKIDYSREYPLYCYFPTQKVTQLKYIIQAPFLLVDNRQDIKHNDWNENLLKLLAQLTADSLPVFKQKGFINDEFFNVLPIKEDNFKYTIFKHFYDLVLQKLKSTEELLPTKERNFTSFGSCYLSDTDRILNLFSSEQLADLLQESNAKWIFPTLFRSRDKGDLGNYVRTNLVVKELSPKDVVSKFELYFTEKQTDEWFLKLYEIFADIKKEVWDILQFRPIIRTNDNKTLVPFNVAKELQVFLPSEIESNFPTVKKIFVENNKSLEFLKGIQIKEPNLLSDIDFNIIPKYKNNEKFDITTLIKHFEIFYQYYNQCPNYEINNFINKIKNIDFILTLKSIENKNCKKSANQIYFKTQELELYFENYNESIYWLNDKEYKNIYEKYGKENIYNFLKTLCVENKPRRILKKLTLSELFNLMDKTEYKTTYYIDINDYELEGLDNFLTNISYKKSLALWEILKNNNYDYFKGIHRYFYRTAKTEVFDANFIRKLKITKWLYTNEDKINPRKPSEILISELADDYKLEISDSNIFIRFDILKFKEKIVTKKIEEWDKLRTHEEKKQVYEIYEKAKEFTDEDFNELKRIKKKREILNTTSSKHLPKRKKNTEIDEGELLDLLALKDLVLNIEHFLKHPLSEIKTIARVFDPNYPYPKTEMELRQKANLIYYAVEKWKTAINFILTFAPDDTKIFENINVTDIIFNIFEQKFRQNFIDENIKYIIDLPKNIQIFYNEIYFEDIITNLIDNSIKALKTFETDKYIKISGNIENDEIIIYFRITE